MNTLKIVIVFVIFYAAGALLHDRLYWWTLDTITFFSNNELHFFGKLWNFLGVPKFGITILLIPLYNFLGCKYFKIKTQKNLFRFWFSFLLFILPAYFIICYSYYQYLLNQIKANKISIENGATPLFNVNIYLITIFSIGVAIVIHWTVYLFLTNRKEGP